MDASGHHGPPQLLCSETLLGELEQGQSIGGDQIRRHHAEAARHRAYASTNLSALRPLGHSLHAAVHLFDRHLFFNGEYAPRIAKGVLQGRVAMSVELVLGLTHQLHTFRYGVFGKCVYIWDADGDRDWRMPQCFRTETAAFRPFASDVDGRIADHQLGVRDAVAHLETEGFLGSQSALVELNRFGRISKS